MLAGSGSGERTLTVRVDDDRCPVSREMTVAVLPWRVRSAPEGSAPAVWRREVLTHAARSGPSVARALARLSLGQGLDGLADALRRALEMGSSRADCADFEAVGLLNLWHSLG